MSYGNQSLVPVGKPAIKSVTVIAGVVGFAASAAGFYGYEVSADDQQRIVSLINDGYAAYLTITGMVASAAAVWGRIRATRQITSAVSSKQ